MKRFNLSAWAVRHPALVLFLILASPSAGTLSFLRLGRAEDPNFTIKVAIVTAVWPGATAQEMQDQVADRIEKKLQELPYFDKVADLHQAGLHGDAGRVPRQHAGPARCRSSSTSSARSSTTSAAELPRDLIGPNVNDEYGDVDSVLYMLTGDGADYAQLEERRRGPAPAPPARCRASSRSTSTACRTRRSSSSSATPSSRPSASRRRPCSTRSQKQNAVSPAGTVETGAQRIPVARHRRARRRARRSPRRRSRRTGASSASATSRP